ncbi:MAG: SDR family NAD(P)-dependent oxidoreductase [Solirubrobacterales bacterium]
MSLPQPTSNSVSLVTGASAGIGQEIARELARRGRDLVITARRKERLEELSEQLQADHGVSVWVVPADLATEDGRQTLTDAISKEKLWVDVLVNNAGYGSGGRFDTLDAVSETTMVGLNCEAVVALCAEYLPAMIDRGAGAVLNIASIVAFQPLPRQATYAATKAFVLSYSQALNAEMGPLGITVTAFCPGVTSSEFAEQGGITEAESQTPGFLLASSEDTAHAAVQALDDGDRVSVHGAANRAVSLAGSLTPNSLLLPLAERWYPVGK